MTKKLDEKDASHLRYMSIILTKRPEEASAVLATIKNTINRPTEDPLSKVLTYMEKAINKTHAPTMRTIENIVKSMVNHQDYNINRAGDILDSALQKVKK